MARKRTKNPTDANVRFGSGRAPVGLKGPPIRIGTKDANQKRSAQINFRVTPEVDAEIREAHRVGGGRVSFAEFAERVILDGLSSRLGSMAILSSESGASAEELRLVARALEAGLAQVSAAEGEAAAALAAVARRQDEFGRLGVANARAVGRLSDAFGELAAQVAEMGDKLERGLARLAQERPLTAAPVRARSATDEFTRKLT